MSDIIIRPRTKDEIKVERHRRHKVILINDDFTLREFVVTVLKAEFRMTEDQALRVMMTAHRRGNGSAYARGLGQTVRILDPFGEVQLDPALRARFNPLDVIDPAGDLAVDDAGRIASAIIVRENQNDPFFEEAARNLLKGLILYVLSAASFEGMRNLASVRRLATQGDWLRVAILRNAGEEYIPSAFMLLWKRISMSVMLASSQMLQNRRSARCWPLGVLARHAVAIASPRCLRTLADRCGLAMSRHIARRLIISAWPVSVLVGLSAASTLRTNELET